jgi:hypothetical protein
VKVADPAHGLITFTVEEFCNNWLSTKKEGEEEGVALLLELVCFQKNIFCNSFLILLPPIKYFIRVKYYIKMSALKNRQYFVCRTVKQLAGCFSVAHGRLAMPSMGGISKTFRWCR